MGYRKFISKFFPRIKGIMLSRRILYDFLTKIIAITEKDLKLRLRFKYDIFVSFINPIISIVMPIIIIGQFFNYNANFGSWTEKTYYIFIFMAYNIILIESITGEFPTQFIREKFWKTLPSLMIAPFNRFNLLFGIFLSHLIIISIPFIFIFILCYLIYPVSFLTILFVILIYFIIALIFSSIGLIIGSFAISKESISRILKFLITIVFLFSCITYPFELFPEIFQKLINLNPLYYIFDFIRLAWIEDNLLITIKSHPIHLIILMITLFVIPILSIYIFNKVYKKFGIAGY